MTIIVLGKHLTFAEHKNTVKDKSDVYHKTRTNLYTHMVHVLTCT